MKKLYLLTCLLLAVTFVAEAQSFYAVRRNRGLILSVGTGTSTYFGELKNNGDYIDAKPNLNLGLHYFVIPNLALRTDFTWFQLSGSDAEADDESRIKRNLSFLANNFEFAFTGAYHLFPNAYRYYQRPSFNVYAFAGLALVYSNPTTELNGIKYALQPLQTEGVKYSRVNFAIPYGLGVKLKVNPFLNLALEGGYRMTFTDYLDDVSTVHPDKTGWESLRVSLSDRKPELGLTPYGVGVQRGNPDKNDGYFIMNVKIEYYLPTNVSLNSKAYRKKRRPYNR